MAQPLIDCGHIAENVQNMKPVQICSGFIFCTFSAAVSILMSSTVKPEISNLANSKYPLIRNKFWNTLDSDNTTYSLSIYKHMF